MRYDQLKPFIEHLRSAKPKHFSPVYCILNKNSYECKEVTDLLLNFLIPLEQQKHSLVSVDGSQIGKQEIKSTLDSYSLFADSRVICITQIDKLRKEALQYIEEHLSALSSHSSSDFLILTGASCAKNTTFYKAIEKIGVVLAIEEPKPWEKEKELMGWLQQRMAAEGKEVSMLVCQSLVQQCGLDPGLLAQETEKLLCYCAEKKEVTQKDIDAVNIHQPLYTVWQWGEAIFLRKTKAALSIAQSLLVSNALPPLLRALRSQFQTEYQVSLLLSQGKDASAITQDFPFMKGRILEQHLRQAREYGVSSFKQGLLAIDCAELQLKTISMSENAIIDSLVLQLTKNI